MSTDKSNGEGLMHSKTFTTTRSRYGQACGRYGSPGLADCGQEHKRSRAVDLHEEILGRPLADGTTVRITVEVINETPWPPDENKWGPPIGSSWDEYEAYLRWPDHNSHGWHGWSEWKKAGKPGWEDAG